MGAEGPAGGHLVALELLQELFLGLGLGQGQLGWAVGVVGFGVRVIGTGVIGVVDPEDT